MISGGGNRYPAEIESVEDIVVPKKDVPLTLEKMIEFCPGKVAKYKISKGMVFTDLCPAMLRGGS